MLRLHFLCIFQRLHTFRHSRVSQTVKLDPEDQDQQQPVVQHQQQPVVVTEREQLQFQAATPESVRQFKRYPYLPMFQLKTLSY